MTFTEANWFNTFGRKYSGQIRIHADGCRDIDRESKQGAEIWPSIDWNQDKGEQLSFWQWVETMDGGRATDEHAENTSEYVAACLANALYDVTVCACARAAWDEWQADGSVDAEHERVKALADAESVSEPLSDADAVSGLLDDPDNVRVERLTRSLGGESVHYGYRVSNSETERVYLTTDLGDALQRFADATLQS